MLFKDYIAENQQIHLPLLKEKRVELWIKREDLSHSEVSGNKFRKLKYNLLEAQKQGYKAVLTFGGAFSNHIAATAAAAYDFGFKAIGVVRGDELANNLEGVLESNPTLKLAHAYEMEFYFVSREQYRNKNDKDFLEVLRDVYDDFYLVPEGGTNELAVQGCEEILHESDTYFDVVCSAIGTGGTIAGLINSAQEHQKVLGFPALKGNFLTKEIQQFVRNPNWELITDYHFGGYAKYNDGLIHFLNEFKQQTQIPLDPIYTGKMLYGILDLITNDYFSFGTKILAIHTGGLQGIKGFNTRLKKKNAPLIV